MSSTDGNGESASTRSGRKPRRAPGQGSIWVRTDKAGNQTFYGKWGSGDGQIKRALGPKRKPGTRSGFTRSQAEAKLRALMDAEQPRSPTGEAITVKEAGERYVEHLTKLDRKRSTLRDARMTLRVHLVPFFGGKPLDGITHADVEDFLSHLLNRERPLKSKSIRNYVGTLSALFNYAKHPKRGWARENPCEGVELPANDPSTDIRFLDPDEVDVLVQAVGVRKDKTYAAIDAALYRAATMTGLRQGELVALRWRDVDWKAARIRVRRNYVRGQFGTPKTKRSERSVPLIDELAGELDRLFKASEYSEDNDLVFADPHTGGPLERAAILRRFQKALEAAQLDDHRFHDLRHTFGTRMAAANVPMRTLQEWMGHRDIETTMIYADYAPSKHEKALAEAAFARRGTPEGTQLSESERISEQPNRSSAPNTTY